MNSLARNLRRNSQPNLPHPISILDNGKIQTLKLIPNRNEHFQTLKTPDKKLTSVSLDTIVDNLVNNKLEINSIFVHTLFTTYVSFTTPEKIITALQKRFIKDETGISTINRKNRLENLKIFEKLLFIWVESYPNDFTEDIISRIKSFNVDEYLTEFRNKINNNSDALQTQRENNNYYNNYQFKNSINFIYVSKKELSEQLTCLDQNLFTSINLRHCLASVKTKSKCISRSTSTDASPDIQSTNSTDTTHLQFISPEACLNVQPFVANPEANISTTKRWTNHFNRVVKKVIASVLSVDIDLTERIAIVEKWIDVSLELRQMKNFSSLKAIISALQSAPIHRIKILWKNICKTKLNEFKELSDLYNYSSNFESSRQLLIEEGTSMTSYHHNFDNANNNTMEKLLSWINMQKKSNYEIKSPIKMADDACGTIPYLGLFLSDLVMIDSAFPDPPTKDLVNFEKKRKEFEILSHIKLLQSSCSLYRFRKNITFADWFNNLPELNETDGYSISLQLFPESCRSYARRNSELPAILSKQDSDSSKNSRNGGDFGGGSRGYLSHNNSFNDSEQSMSAKNKFCSMESLNCLDGEDDHDTLAIVRFYLYKKNGTYKSIKVKREDRTRSLIKIVLIKFRSTENFADFNIQQCLPSGECILIPDNCNVFYALMKRNMCPLECLLIKKS